MAIKVTRLQDVFKNKLKESVNVPTIWVDLKTGQEYDDYEYTRIGAYMSWTDANDEPFTIKKDQIDYFGGTADRLLVRGAIKQIGSHVEVCGCLMDQNEQAPYPFLDQIGDVFKNARNLKDLELSLYNIDKYSDTPLIVPENLLWNCPKLQKISSLFEETKITEIPANLLSKCPNLISVYSFCEHTQISEIPEGLFDNNSKIRIFIEAFKHTNITKIPDSILEQFKDGILNGKIDVDYFAQRTPISKLVNGPFFKDDSTTEEEKALKRAKYLPSYLPAKIQASMLALDGKYKEKPCFV